MTGVSGVLDMEDEETERTSLSTDGEADWSAANRDLGESSVVTDWDSNLTSL
jgi:hypothetical protein